MAISIVIPVYNEEKYIIETIDVIKNLLEGRVIFEVIVVNNASTDHTASLLSDVKAINVITLMDKVTVARARNLGWKEAKNHVVAFIDGDMIIAEEWAKEIHKNELRLVNDALVVTGCKCHPSRKPSWIEQVWFKNENYRSVKEKYINSGNLITTKSVLNLISGFDEKLITGEDVDFCMRAKQLGAQLDINPGFKIYHEGYPKSLTAFIRRERWHGVGDLASIKHFLSSKVAVLSAVVMSLLTAALALLILNFKLFIFPLLLALGITIAAAHYKFNPKDKSLWIKIYALQFFYFIGRALSFTIKNRV